MTVPSYPGSDLSIEQLVSALTKAVATDSGVRRYAYPSVHPDPLEDVAD